MIMEDLIVKMTEFNAGDPKRIQHFLKVYEFAHVIGIREGLDPETLHILEMAAILHLSLIHIFRAKDIDTRVTGRSTGHPIRALRNDMTKAYLQKEQEGASTEELELLASGALRRAVQEGDIHNGSLMSGQIAGLIKEEVSCKQLIDTLVSQTKEALNRSRMYE